MNFSSRSEGLILRDRKCCFNLSGESSQDSAWYSRSDLILQRSKVLARQRLHCVTGLLSCPLRDPGRSWSAASQLFGDRAVFDCHWLLGVLCYEYLEKQKEGQSKFSRREYKRYCAVLWVRDGMIVRQSPIISTITNHEPVIEPYAAKPFWDLAGTHGDIAKTNKKRCTVHTKAHTSQHGLRAEQAAEPVDHLGLLTLPLSSAPPAAAGLASDPSRSPGEGSAA